MQRLQAQGGKDGWAPFLNLIRGTTTETHEQHIPNQVP
jgi:hypothetical protein